MSLTSRTILALSLLLASACGSASPPASDADEASDLTPDAGADAGEPGAPDTTCCRLDNERGERLNYMCGVAVDAAWAEARGYRCWVVTAPR